MNNITFDGGDNMGGMNTFQFIPHTDVQTLPEAVNKVISSAIVPKAGKTIFSGYATPESLNARQEGDQSDNGAAYKTEISGFVPGDTEAQVKNYEEMEQYRFIVIARSNNGKKKVYGTLLNPLRFVALYNDGRTTAGRNGYDIKFYEELPERSPFYTA